MSALSRRLRALERRLPPPRPPSLLEEYPDLPPGSDDIVAAAVLDLANALDIATGGAALSVIGPGIMRHHDRVIEALRSGRPVPGPLTDFDTIIDPAAVAELLTYCGGGDFPGR